MRERFMISCLSEILFAYLNVAKKSRAHITSREAHSNNIFCDVRQIQIKSSFLEKGILLLTYEYAKMQISE